MTGPALHSVSVAAVITNEAGEVLMIRRRDNGNLEPPGGVLELDESIRDGLVREVREETGLLVRLDYLTGIYKNLPRGIVAIVFRATIVGGDPVPCNKETTSMGWLSVMEVNQQCSESFAVRVTDALRTGRPAAVRTHDGIKLIAESTSDNA